VGARGGGTALKLRKSERKKTVKGVRWAPTKKKVKQGGDARLVLREGRDSGGTIPRHDQRRSGHSSDVVSVWKGSRIKLAYRLLRGKTNLHRNGGKGVPGRPLVLGEKRKRETATSNRPVTGRGQRG